MEFFIGVIKFIIVVVLIAVSALVAVVAVVKNPGLGAIDLAKDGVQVDTRRLRAHVDALARISPARSFQNLLSMEQAANYIQRVWEAQGYRVEHQSFLVEGRTYQNLIVSAGPANAAERFVVGAHYDVAGEQPGADDNASGIAGLLELSQLFASETALHQRIDFVAYSLEEPPYFSTESMGSAHHAALLRQQNVNVRLMLSLEMLGYYSDKPGSQKFPFEAMKYLYPDRGDFIAIVGNLKTLTMVRKLRALMRVHAGLPVESLNAIDSFPGVGLSDHMNYWRQGYPAVMITDTAFFRNPHYHTAEDRPETLNYENMAEVVKGLFSALRRL